MSENRLTVVREAMDRLRAVWAGADGVEEMSRSQLIAVNDALAATVRGVQAVQVEVAARIAHESRSELGPGSLAKQQGFRSPTKLIAAATGVSSGEAARLVAVGEATAPRADLLGQRLPARYPVVRETLAGGELSTAAAGAIVAMLDKCRVAASAERIAEAERVLVEKAVGLALEDVRRLVVRAEAWLDPDGVQPREQERRGRRSLVLFERDGMVHLNAVLDAETAAPVVTAVRGFVSAVFATRKDAADAGAAAAGAGADAGAAGAGAGAGAAAGGAGSGGGAGGAGAGGVAAGVDGDRRTVPMIQADALAVFCAHALGCEAKLPLAGATVVVRVGVEALESGAGSAQVDGIDQPVSVGAVRRMAAGGGVIPCVLGGDSEVLDWGRERRLFTRAQRWALVERDGGCAMCGVPPEMTRAHHIRWWSRDRGPTDLSNGVLLCETCHHRIHDNGWGIRIEPARSRGSRGHERTRQRVWFIPPRHVDPQQTPRLGGRARFDIAA